MKAKSSRGIVMKLICCTALVVLSSAVAFSQASNVSISAASRSGSNTTYSYTLISGLDLQVGKSIAITGMSDPGVSISGVTQKSGSSSTYAYTLTSGPDLVAGETIVVTGFTTDTTNNGRFVINSVVPATSFTVTNAAGVVDSGQTASGKVTGNNGTYTITGVVAGSTFTVVNASGLNATGQTGTGIEFSITSGALLTIKNSSNSATLLNLYDSQIHSGTVQQVALDGTCQPGDQVPTDAYVLQGGAPTGCDPNDPFEVTDNNNFNTAHQAFGKTDLLGFHIETHYKMNTAVSISGASDASAGSTTYNYTLTSGPDLQAQESIVITGMNSGNNGTFTISSVGSGTFIANNASGVSQSEANGTGAVTWCNTSGTICASPDSGFLTVKNNNTSATGAISLTGTSPTPTCGDASDSTPSLGVGQSVTLALGAPGGNPTLIDSSNCGGFNQAQILTLTANQESKATFGKDDYKITPQTSVTGDTLSVLPLPFPAGPLGSVNFTAFPSGQFGLPGETPTPSSPFQFSATNFTNLACIPYADFSADKNPVCVELQLTPGGPSNGSYFYTAINDFNIDGHSLPSGIGGPALLGHHGVPCPDSGFDINILLSYTAPTVTFGDPLKGGGSGTGSCWVVAFDPNVQAVAAGSTVFTFSGLQSPVLPPPKFTKVNAGSAVPLTWQQFTSSNTPVTTLSLCTSVGNTGATCAGGASAPWVSIGTIQIRCTSELPVAGAVEVSAAGGSTLQNFLNGTYRFSLKTTKKQAGTCEAVIFQYDTGVFFITADLNIK